jgi:hypothetical protein
MAGPIPFRLAHVPDIVHIAVELVRRTPVSDTFLHFPLCGRNEARIFAASRRG